MLLLDYKGAESEPLRGLDEGNGDVDINIVKVVISFYHVFLVLSRVSNVPRQPREQQFGSVFKY